MILLIESCPCSVLAAAFNVAVLVCFKDDAEADGLAGKAGGRAESIGPSAARWFKMGWFAYV